MDGSKRRTRALIGLGVYLNYFIRKGVVSVHKLTNLCDIIGVDLYRAVLALGEAEMSKKVSKDIIFPVDFSIIFAERLNSLEPEQDKEKNFLDLIRENLSHIEEAQRRGVSDKQIVELLWDMTDEENRNYITLARFHRVLNSFKKKPLTDKKTRTRRPKPEGNFGLKQEEEANRKSYGKQEEQIAVNAGKSDGTLDGTLDGTSPNEIVFDVVSKYRRKE